MEKLATALFVSFIVGVAALHGAYGLTAVIGSHSSQVAANCDRVFQMESGVLHEAA